MKKGSSLRHLSSLISTWTLRMVDMMLRLEEMGISIPLEVAWQIETVGDAYRYCTEHVPSERQRLSPPKEAAA